MRLLATGIGGAICGALCFGIWPEMWKSYGIMGGWLTAAIVISICWYMNHWLGIFWNQPGRIWVDQGFAVAAAGVAWAMVRFNAQFRHAAPVMLCCLVGGALAGIAAAQVKKLHPGFQRASEESADFVKTSTVFGPAGATVEDVRLMREAVGPSTKVKAAGGVRDLETALAMVEAGASRIGTSHGVAIVRRVLEVCS